MTKSRFESRPKIFWKKGKAAICKQIDGIYHLCLERDNGLVYTGIVSKNMDDLIKEAEVKYGDVA